MNNTFVSLNGVLRGRRGLNEAPENKKWPFCSKVSFLTLFAWITKKTNSREPCCFQRKKDKNLNAILKEKRSTHTFVVTNFHFKLSAIVDIVIILILHLLTSCSLF